MVDGRIRRREPYSKLLTRLVPGFNCFDVITDAAQIPLHHVPVSFLYIATDIAEDLLSGPDIVMDVLEALFEHGSLIIEIVCILQVPCHHHHESLFVCEQVQSWSASSISVFPTTFFISFLIRFSFIALVESARMERICAMIFASNSVTSGVNVQ